jgi:hypothetical protein
MVTICYPFKISSIRKSYCSKEKVNRKIIIKQIGAKSLTMACPFRRSSLPVMLLKSLQILCWPVSYWLKETIWHATVLLHRRTHEAKSGNCLTEISGFP